MTLKNRVCTLALSITGLCALLMPPPARGQQANQTRFVVATVGNEARYRVREQLAGINFPSDAVGATSAVSGGITLDAAGKIVPATSKLIVDITGLKSDSDRRDRIIQNGTLQTAQYPKVELAVKELRGLTYPWPKVGEVMFELTGDLTVHGVTKPSTWQVIATTQDGGIAGVARTSFTFEDFGMVPPKGMSVLTVEDLIKLEYSFRLVASH